VEQSLCRVEAIWETPCSLQRTCPIVYIMFLSEDIGAKVAVELRSPRKKVILNPRLVGKGDTTGFYTCVLKLHLL